MNPPRLAHLPHYVYRLSDGHGALLYIGCTAHLRQRLYAHACWKMWFATIEAVDVRVYPNQEPAMAVEASEILAHRPRYNVIGTRGRIRRETDVWNVDNRKRAARDGVSPSPTALLERVMQMIPASIELAVAS